MTLVNQGDARLGPHGGWGRGQPPRTTLTRIPLSAFYAATRWWLSASEVLRRRYGSAEAAPTPTRLPARPADQGANESAGPLSAAWR
jgi:hypothetical protein